MATSAGSTAIETALRASLPPQALTAASEAHAIDGVTPAFVATPETIEEAAAALRAVNEAGAAAIARGAGAHSGLGMPPARYDVALDLSRLNRIIEYEPANLTVTVETGVLLSQLQATLAEHGQWLPIDPPAPDGTIGGLLAANRSGPARIVHGAARDLTIGLQALTADGQLIKSGGRVVKNVAGYDLAKLHIGALGTLGVLVQASFKIAPLPAETASLTLAGSRVDIMSSSLRVRNLGLAVNGIIASGSGDDWRLTVRFAGGHAAVERSRRDVEALTGTAGLKVPNNQARPLPNPLPEGEGTATIIRLSLPPTAVTSHCSALAGAGADILAYPTAGIVRGTWQASPSIDVLTSLRKMARGAGGALVVEAAPVALKRQFDVWGEPGPEFGLMRTLKQQFDPRGTLSPGRFVGGL